MEMDKKISPDRSNKFLHAKILMEKSSHMAKWNVFPSFRKMKTKNNPEFLEVLSIFETFGHFWPF